MKTFYSAEEIETLAGQGVRELVVDEDTVLTSVAQEAAERLGVRLVTPGQKPGRHGDPETRRRGDAAVTPQKPRGCQHGPLGRGAGTSDGAAKPAGSSGGPVVDELIGAVKQLARRG